MDKPMSEFENKYAVVGMGGVFPGARNVDEFWNNIVNKRVSIQRLPKDSPERDVFFRPELLNQADKHDSSYTDVLALVPELDFDPQQFRLPPSVAKRMDDNQKLALLSTSEALAAGALTSIAKERVCVFIGATMFGTLFNDYLKRFAHHELLHRLGQSSPECYDRAKDESTRLLAGTLAVTEDSAPGCLLNINAARIASVFDFHGHAFVIDAACASALAAIICGLQHLRSGEADAVVCGAVDMPNRVEGRILFSGIGALSPDGSFPFDARANGFVIGQGGGVVVIKRLRDAVHAGDVIHAVVTGYGQCSDGRGKAIAAPSERWQAEAIRRACVMAQVDVDSIEMIEAHGTSTPVGDQSEVAALKRCFAELGATGKGYCGLTSVKSNIGHLKSAAGIAGFIKTALALRNGILPPTASFETENPKLRLADSPFYVLKDAREWPTRKHPRRAGVSAFGFGGADYHIQLEQFRATDYPRLGSVAGTAGTKANAPPAPHEVPELRPIDVSSSAAVDYAPEASACEIALFSADTFASLLEQLDTLTATLAADTRALPQVLLAHNARVRATARYRLALTLRGARDLAAKAALVRGVGADPDALAALSPRGIYFGSAEPVQANQVALMFPGQGSQYPDMMLPLCRHFATAATTAARADAVWSALGDTTISSLIASERRGAQATEQLLRETRHTHPTLMLASLATYQVLAESGLRAGAMIGHSLGEYTALVAAGVLSFADGFSLMRERGESFSLLEGDQAGAMLALPLNEEHALRALAEANVSLAVANLNARQQTTVSGLELEVEKLLAYCKAHRIDARRLNVSHAFHSPLMRPAEERFGNVLRSVALRPATVRVIANSDNEYYGDSIESIRGKLSAQITSSVRFAASIERLYADGFRAFVEVGPSSVLCACTKEILADKQAAVLSSDSRKGDSLEAFCRMLCGLFALGLPMDPSACSRVTQGGPKTSSASGPITLGKLQSQASERIVYGGVSAGLPGSFKDSFRDDNFDQLFEGRNLIERLSDHERQQLVDLRISKLIKSEQGASYATLEALDDVLQLAGKLGRLNLPRDYHIDEKDAANMSGVIAHAVAAGYEALRDAQIPLIHEYAQTAAGSVLPDRWALPSEMQSSTGVIFANGFPMVDPIIAEVSRHLSYRLGNRVKQELLEFYDTLIEKVAHRESRKILADWFALNYGRLCGTPSQQEVYSFNHQLMTQIAMQANNRFAKAVAARGPNFQLNAACSSTATAVTLAEELIRSGRVRRMIVISADDPSSEFSLPYLGGGFLSTGACTSEGDLYAAAIPFDKRRNGMIMGAGAVGLVVESADECAKRGVTPVCELVGTHCFNTASHGSQLDVPRYAEELEVFIQRVEVERGLSRAQLAKRMVYVSHETYTPARGGCSEAEAVALRHVFGEDFRDVEISNTKGMTGHTMGASLEDAVAAKALQYGRIPPVVNHRVVDPVLEGLKLSTGGHRSVDFALRMAAGFGSQGNFLLLAKAADGDARIFDQARYADWLNRISGLRNAELSQRGRQLVVKDAQPGSVLSSRPSVSSTRPSQAPLRIPAPRLPSFAGSSAAPSTFLPPETSLNRPAANTTQNVQPPHRQLASQPATSAHTAPDIQQVVLEILSEVTGYATAMLDLDMELEADLGIDTVKQATVLSRLADRLGLADATELRLSEYPTLRRIVELFAGQAGVGETAPPPVPAEHRATDDVAALVRQTIAEVTGYSTELLTADLELEADLGVDTVKQATILGILSERLPRSGTSELRMSEISKIGDVISLFSSAEPAHAVEHAPTLSPAPVRTPAAAVQPSLDSAPPARPPLPAASTVEPPRAASADEPHEASVLTRVYAAIAAHSPYPAEMLEPDLSLTTDMGLSDDALERIRTQLTSDFALPADYRLIAGATIDQLVESVMSAVYASKLPRLRAAPLARQVLQLYPAPLSAPKLELSGKHVWILGDEPASVRLLQGSLRDVGATVCSLTVPVNGDLQELDVALDQLLAAHTTADILIDTTLSPVESVAVGADSAIVDPARTLSALARTADCRFAVWKRLQREDRIPSRVLAVTCLDGRCGTSPRSARSREPLYGFSQGFYRTLRKELADCRVTLLDTRSSDWLPEAPSVTKLVANELITDSEGIDVCYVDAERYRVALTDMARPAMDAALQPESDEVILVTGGGAGITSALIVGLAQLQPACIALIGRTVLDDAARHFHSLSAQQRLAEKPRLAARLEQSHARVTPVMIERAYAELQRADEILCTLEELRRAGCRAEYYSADVTDLTRLREVVACVRKTLGPVTTIVHGAGLELSHGLAQKSPEEFRRVHAVKTLGAFHLSLLCGSDPLRRVFAMSSIAGLLGSEGQLDYAAANAFLDQWVHTLGAEGKTRSLSLVWSGWADRGIASRSEFLRRNADAIGLHLIEPAHGVLAGLYEILTAPAFPSVVLHRGISGLMTPALSSTIPRVIPMIDWVELRSDYERVVHRRFSTSRDVFLDQHRLAGTPLMPGVGFMEWMAETCATLQPGRSGAFVFRQLQFLDAFKLYRGEPRDAQLLVTGPIGASSHEMRILAPLTGPLAASNDLKSYCHAQLSIESLQGLQERASGWELGDLRPAAYAQEFSHAHELSQNVILGPLFNDAHHASFRTSTPDIEWGPRGIITRVPLPRAQLEQSRYPLDHYLINPAFLDAMHQAGAVLAIELTGQIYLPVGAREFVVQSCPNEPGDYRVVARLKQRSTDDFLYDIAFWKDEGTLCAVAWDVAFRRISQ